MDRQDEHNSRDKVPGHFMSTNEKENPPPDERECLTIEYLRGATSGFHLTEIPVNCLWLQQNGQVLAAIRGINGFLDILERHCP